MLKSGVEVHSCQPWDARFFMPEDFFIFQLPLEILLKLLFPYLIWYRWCTTLYFKKLTFYLLNVDLDFFKVDFVPMFKSIFGGLDFFSKNVTKGCFGLFAPYFLNYNVTEWLMSPKFLKFKRWGRFYWAIVFSSSGLWFEAENVRCWSVASWNSNLHYWFTRP